MTGLKKSVVVALVSATVLCPRLSPAMEIRFFDQLANQDQRDYLKFLVKGAQKVLIEQGRRDLAEKVRRLFHDIPPGDRLSIGETQFEKDLAISRAFNADNPNAPLRVPVEASLVVTLTKNGIETSSKFVKGLAEVARTFWPKRPLRQN